jgi:hypothetical protein
LSDNEEAPKDILKLDPNQSPVNFFDADLEDYPLFADI